MWPLLASEGLFTWNKDNRFGYLRMRVWGEVKIVKQMRGDCQLNLGSDSWAEVMKVQVQIYMMVTT